MLSANGSTMQLGFGWLKSSRLALAVCATLAFFGGAGRAKAQCTGSNPYTCTETQSVSIPAGPNGTGFGTWVPATVYPSELTVSGLSGTITTVSVQLHGLTSDGQGAGLGTADMGVLLKGPNGLYVELMGQAGNSNNGELWTGSGVLLNIQDGGTRMPDDACPSGSGSWPNLDVSNGTSEGGPFEPTSCPFGNSYDTYPSPGPGTLTSGEVAAPAGSATLAGAFGGLYPNGTWSLYLVNDEGEYSIDDDQSISGWSLIFTLNQTQSSTTTALSSSTNPSFTSGTGNSTTLTATVTGSPSPSGGTVAFKDGGNTISCSGGNQALSGSQATCITTFTTQGSHALTATYSGSGTFAGSTGSLSQFVETPTTGSFCNAGGITMPGQDNTSPYPSVINVTGISNAVATVSLTLNGFSWSPSANAVHLLLVSPSDQAFEFFAATTDASAGDYTFSDTGTPITEADEEGALSPGTYEPAVYTEPPPAEDVFTPQPPNPAPQVPSSFTVAAPRGNPGAGTFENTFNGATANGAWALFVYDDAGSNANGSMTGGWCLDITQASGAATTTTVTTTPDPSLTGAGVTVTATVKSGGNPVNSGTVTFTENGQNVAGGPTGPVSVNGSGLASFSTATMPEGDHNILATYNGVANTYALSFGSKIQRVDSVTTSSMNSGVISYCNPGTITIHNPSNSIDEGQASPNPSNIFVAKAPGTINHVTVTLNGVELSTPYFLTSLLVGPLNTTADSLDFFSDVGGSTPMSAPVNVTLDDNASSTLGTGSGGAALETGSFKPTSGKGSDTFFANTDGFYAPPSSPYLYAAPFSGTTLGDVFDTQNPNGTWSLYLNQDNQSANSSMSSWCVNLTENAPAVSATVPATGTLTQGKPGSFTVSIENNGPGSTGDPSGGNPMTVTDALNPAFSYSSYSGTGWSCSASLQNVTCTNDSPIAASSSYPELTIDVNVSGTATGSITNSVTASGAGADSAASNSETIAIDVPPGITSANSTTFNVGIAGSFSVTSVGTPTPTYSETGPLPSGVTLSSAGVLSGTPAAETGGSYSITITAQNGVSPSATQGFTLTVDQAPDITSAASSTFTVGTAGSFPVMATGYPAPTYSESGTLPAGVTFTSAGLLSGTPAGGAGGTYPITITAQNGVSPSAMQTFTLTVTQACTNPNPNPNPNPASFANPGDFNGNCRSDILWRNSGSEEVYTWLMDGISIAGQGSPGDPSSDWVIQGAGDFDGDGKSDILWRNSGTGEVYLWLMDGTTIASQGDLGDITSDWVIQGVGEFNGDGKADILWRNSTTGEVYIWQMNGNAIASQGDLGEISSDWVIRGVGDFNGDGKADILWQNSTTGEVYIWLVNGTTITGQGSPYTVSPSSGWVIQGVGDFDGDGKSDILWRNSATGDVYIWLMNGTTIAGQGDLGVITSDWVIQGTGDYNGDGKADILWRNSTSGDVYIWLMNGISIANQGGLGDITSDWVINPMMSP